jgi:hypothetical protein
MNTEPNPAVSQQDRDAIDDVGLADDLDHTGAEEPKLLHHDERTPS